ncbi:hypothetical protein SESBI_36912 [Sesbania bispinosa]|nr:hypothetical protein SESBI_36912 [Sesbania bispinosa]
MASWSNIRDIELETMPLSQRLELIRYELRNGLRKPITPIPSLDAVVRNEHKDCDSQVPCPNLQIESDSCGVEKTSVDNSILPQCQTAPCDVPATVKVEDSEILPSSVGNGRDTSLQVDIPALKVKKEIYADDYDELDHITLKERQRRLLLARNLQRLSNPAFEGYSGGLSENILEQTVEKVNEDIYADDGKTTVAKDQCHDTQEGSNASLSESPPGTTSGSSLSIDYASLKSTKSVISSRLQQHEEQCVMPINNDGPSSSTCPTSVKIKDEPLDNCDTHNINKDAMGSISVKLPNVKSEWDVHNKYDDDQLENMRLIDRLNILMAREDSDLNISTSYSSLKRTKPSITSSSTFSESAEPSCIKCPRKRKKTATDSVQTALEEDAPGLLQVLLDKGVLVDEIKLYGETENDEPLDESFCEDSFSELEAVITKIFSQRHSFLKFPIVRAAKATRASYCLACLISLVEQTRYLKFRKWPVEWGWCRDLQSFIFVFKKHNRIVLERPEYGYATYFFELVESLPVEWQIKRLVIAMKLTTCSRISLIENKELLVGEDLTEGEAKVLMEYGWAPNSGLGTMLNYRDRVVHDRKTEDPAEWRSKIGKLLMDGYSGGTIVTPNIPKKAVEYRQVVCMQYGRTMVGFKYWYLVD